MTQRRRSLGFFVRRRRRVGGCRDDSGYMAQDAGYGRMQDEYRERAIEKMGRFCSLVAVGKFENNL